jgi:hypothetical protein
MLVEIIVGVVLFSGGFAIGRIKNTAKLNAIKAEAEKLELAVETDAKKVIAAIKAKL